MEIKNIAMERSSATAGPQQSFEAARSSQGFMRLKAILDNASAVRAPAFKLDSPPVVPAPGATSMASHEPAIDHVVTVSSVLRGGSIIVGASTLLALVGTVLSGTVIIHPLLSLMLLISSVAFYLMSRLER